MERVRLQKIFTDAGIMSRRAAEAEIDAGLVTVNGNVASLGDKADPENDIIEYKGERIVLSSSKPVYVMLNKPMGYVTTMKDEQGRKNVSELVAGVGRRVYPVGRLDMYSEGLLLFTDDGEMANRLTHPSHTIGKVYRVKIKGALTDRAVDILNAPMVIDGYKIRPVEVSVISKQRTDRAGNLCSVVEITLFEGRNRQVRKMCQVAGLQVMRLRRIRIGEISLDKLPLGEWRYLTDEEIEYLKSI